MSIYVEPDKIWRYFIDNKKSLGFAADLIAENPEYGIEIFLQEENGYPQIIVEADGTIVYSRETMGYDDCIAVAYDVYDRYLTDNAIQMILSLEGVEEEYSEDDEYIEELMIERENELDDAVYDLLTVFAPDYNLDVCSDADLFEGLKDHICEYLWQECGVSVYRPMFLEEDGGNEVFEGYPYPEIAYG